MKVTIETTNWFKRYTNGDTRIEIDIKPGTTALEAIIFSGIPDSEVGLILVGNNKAKPDYVLENGDILKIYPVIIGG